MDLGTPRRLATLGAEEIDRREVAVDLLDELLRIALLEHDRRVHDGAQDPLKSSGNRCTDPLPRVSRTATSTW